MSQYSSSGISAGSSDISSKLGLADNSIPKTISKNEKLQETQKKIEAFQIRMDKLESEIVASKEQYRKLAEENESKLNKISELQQGEDSAKVKIEFLKSVNDDKSSIEQFE